MLPGPATVALVPFAKDAVGAVRAISVRALRPDPARLTLEYELTGALTGLSLPAPTATSGDGPTDGLWRHTCMELFVITSPRGPYLEYNLAPSGQWAAYRFSGYREGMTPLTGIRPPRIELRTQPGQLLLSADVALPQALADYELTLGVTAVIEETAGGLGYWALRHPGERPDFHHPDGFGLEI